MVSSTGADRVAISVGDRLLVHINSGNDIGAGPHGWFAQSVVFLEDQPGSPAAGEPREYPAAFPLMPGWLFWGAHLAIILALVAAAVLLFRWFRARSNRPKP